MRDWLPFLIIGVVSGSVYGLAGTGLVLTYKTSGVFNFAHGSVAAIGVLVFYWLHVDHGISALGAAAIAILVVAPAMGLCLELIARSLGDATPTLKVVATIGLVLIALGVGQIWYGGSTKSFPAFLPTATFSVAGVYVGWDQVIVITFSIAATAGLWLFFRHSRMGTAMRAVVDYPDLVALTGTSPSYVRRVAWIIGSMFAVTSGLLLAPGLGLNTLLLTLLVVQAFGAAAIGYFSNLILTYAGGLVLGVIIGISTKLTVTFPSLAGLPPGLPFVILFLALILTPRSRLRERRKALSLPIRQSWYAPPRVRFAFGLGVIAVFACAPTFVGLRLAIWSQVLVDIILFVSLGLLIRMSGQISLCHFGFAAVGAAAMGHLTSGEHWPWLLALVAAGLLTVPVGALVAVPAVRLSGVFLAIATLGFGLLLEQMIYPLHLMFGPTSGGISVPRPMLSIGPWDLQSDTGYYYVLLIAAVVAVILSLVVKASRLGRLLRGLAESPVGLETLGVSISYIRVAIFCVSAFLAGVAGALGASLFHFAYAAEFSSFASLQLVCVVVIAVAGDPWYAVIAAIGNTLIAAYVPLGGISNYMLIVFGVSAATFALQADRVPSVPRWIRKLAGDNMERTRDTPSRSAVQLISSGEIARQVGPAPALSVGRAPLIASHLTVKYGGITAVDGVSFAAPLGRITGLVGPNGAGKTSVFNACSGLVHAAAGSISFGGREITRLSTARRARLGLGRSFQTVEIFRGLSVRSNVELAAEARSGDSYRGSRYRPGHSRRPSVESAAEEALALTGISHLADRQAGLLSTGEQRLVELARVLAGSFALLLLDEPSAGLDQQETIAFGRILTRVVADRGIGILLVEHDMALVQAVCETVYVLDFGRIVFAGPPSAMLDDQVVRAAYIGRSEDLEIELERDMFEVDDA